MISFGFWPANIDPNSDYDPDWSALTVMCNLDWEINADGTLFGKKPLTEPNHLLLVSRSHEHDVRCLVGCGSGSPNLIDSIFTHPTEFANAILNKIQTTDADGISLDFETPRLINSITGTSNTPLLEEMLHIIYDTLKAANPSYEVNLCVNAYLTDEVAFYRNTNLNNYVDSVFMMTYDYYWNGPTGSNCPLYADSTRIGMRNSVEDFTPYFSLNKLIFGLPLYGYEYDASSYLPSAHTTYANQILLKNVVPDTYGRRWDEDSKTPYYYYLLQEAEGNVQTVIDSCDTLGSTANDHNITRTIDTSEKQYGTGSYRCTVTTAGNAIMQLRNDDRWDISDATYFCTYIKAPAGRVITMYLLTSVDIDYVAYTFNSNGNWQAIQFAFQSAYSYGTFDPTSVHDIRISVANAEVGDVFYVDQFTTDTSLPTYRQVWYEDEESLALKFQYIKDTNLGGVGYWALGYEGNNNTAIWNVFNQSTFSATHNFKLFKSLNISDTTPASNGGDISTNEIPAVGDLTIFDRVSKTERRAGNIEYRKVFFQNLNSTSVPVKCWISSNTRLAGTSVSLALAVSNSDTQAAASSYTYYTPNSKSHANVLDLGTIAANAYKGIWIKRTIPAGSTGLTGDGFILNFATY